MAELTNTEHDFLTQKAIDLRKNILKMITLAKSGHPGGSLSLVELFIYLYEKELQVSPETIDSPNRNRLVLSKGHAAPVLYATLAMKGFFDESELWTLRKVGSILQGHPVMNKVPGVEVTTGSLGQGFSAACGIALGARCDNLDYRTYVILGDGELQEGQVWEAAMFAGHYELDNLIAFVDNNGLQIDGSVEDVMSPLPIGEKFAAFGWNVLEIDGHDFRALEWGIEKAKTYKGAPTVIVMKTVKGKGVSEMENQAGWHGKAPSDEELVKFTQELEA